MITLIKNRYRIREELFLESLKTVIQKLNITGDISIRLGGEEESKALNRKYLKRDYPTDVLSFPMNQQLPGGYYRGDIFICLPMARKQARSKGHSLNEELITLMVHGLLHLAGYDHETDTGEMQTFQDQLMEEI